MPETLIQPYLNFSGRCQEALDFYRTAVGAQVDMVMRFKETPEPLPPGMLPPGFENKVMHSSFRIGGSTVMATDGIEANVPFSGFSLAFVVATVPEAEQAFTALSAGGTVKMPLGETFWSPAYGMLTDKFGVVWQIVTMAPHS